MSDNNTRWRPHLVPPFDVSAPPQKPAQHAEPDRSWLPKPTVAVGGIDWWRHGGAERAWEPAVQWAKRDQPAFHSQLAAAETELVGLEKTLPSHHPRIAPARALVSRYYSQLGKIHDNHVKSLPFVRY